MTTASRQGVTLWGMGGFLGGHRRTGSKFVRFASNLEGVSYGILFDQ
jgi:hypothetical protein